MKSSSARGSNLSFLLALSAGILAIAAAYYFRPLSSQSNPALLESSASLRVERSGLGLAFLPAQAKSPGLIFYPGARLPPDAYAYLGRALAEEGRPVLIAAFPLNFALFAPARAEALMAAHSEYKAWVLGGHALGGAVAARYASSHQEAQEGGALAGLLLLGAYPGAGVRLGESSLPTLLISATNDGLATGAKISRSRALLPAGARLVELAGGNHAQFGDYGAQEGDGAAEIPGSVQRRLVVEETKAFLDTLSRR